MDKIKKQEKEIKLIEENREYLYSLKRKVCECIDQLNYEYKKTYEPCIYNRFKNIGDLCDLRMEMTSKLCELQDSLVLLDKKIKECNVNFACNHNNLLYLEMLLNKIN